MKRLILPFVFAMTVLAQPAPRRSVYIVPMAGGLDQFLAAQIAREHVMEVVADPKQADALMTDRLGEGFQQTLVKVHKLDGDPDESSAPVHSFRSGVARGTIFLVDAKSRKVIWSGFEKPPRTVSDKSLLREAEDIVKHLQEGLGK